MARIKAQAANTQADAEAYRVIASAQAEAKRLKIEAEARAEATRMEADAEAGATRIKAQADAQVIDQFAREMELRRLEVNRIMAFGSKTVFVPSDSTGVQMGNAMAVGMAASLGTQAAQRK